MLKITRNPKKYIFYVDQEMQDIMKEFCLIKRNLIISTTDTDCVNFLENSNRYGAENFNVH